MTDRSSELAAAILEHSKLIHVLTDRVERQRRAVTRLFYLVAVTLALQVFWILFTIVFKTAARPYGYGESG